MYALQRKIVSTTTARKQTPYLYQVNGKALQGTPNTPYLGVTLSADLKFTRAVLRLVWPPILLLFIERWRHLADNNDPNFIKKNVF